MSDSDSSDEGYDGILKKALNVELPENFNPNAIPQNGEEYLQHVIYERKKCKKFVTAHIDRNKFKNKQTVHVILDGFTTKAPGHCLPSKEWQVTRIDDFTYFRKFIHSKILTEPSVTSFEEESFIEKIKKDIPYFSQITKYSQASKIKMLQLISKHLSGVKPGDSIDDNVGTWIYTILTLLEIPLSPSCCHTLREFAKQCAIIRSNLPDGIKEELYVPLNLFICIVARYFNQLDLAD